GARILMLLTRRPAFALDWGGEDSTRICLDRMSDEHVVAMVECIASGKRLPDEVHRYIVEKTDGVPIFVEELTRAVLESSWLVESGDGYAVDRPLHTLTIPANLQDLLLTRLDR